MKKSKKKPRVKTRNSLEQANFDLLYELGVDFEYEPYSIPYSIQAEYNPDFVIKEKIIVETKGYFRVEDKRKMKSLKKSNPHLDVRMVFSEPKTPSAHKELERNIRWCKRNDFPYAVGLIPIEWINES
jgi:hypothetical protein